MGELARLFTVRIGKPGEDIISYGDKGEEFFIILKGEVDVLIPNRKIKGWRYARFEYL